MKRPTWTIAWNDEMSVGIAEVDADHKRFIAMILDFNHSMTVRMDRTEIKKRLQLIVEDAERHFALEENLFKEWNYPDTGNHAFKHAEALKSLHAIMTGFIPYGVDSGWIDAGLNVKNILINHILEEDMKYADFYKKSKL